MPASAGTKSPVELGVTFRADSNGYITGIRFYKSTGNTGTHVGNLWSSGGTLLASATFTGESAWMATGEFFQSGGDHGEHLLRGLLPHHHWALQCDGELFRDHWSGQCAAARPSEQ